MSDKEVGAVEVRGMPNFTDGICSGHVVAEGGGFILPIHINHEKIQAIITSLQLVAQQHSAAIVLVWDSLDDSAEKCRDAFEKFSKVIEPLMLEDEKDFSVSYNEFLSKGRRKNKRDIYKKARR